MSTKQFSNISIFNRQAILNIIKVAIAVILIVYLVRTVSLSQISSAFASADTLLLITAAILSIPNLFLQFYKWKVICRHVLNEDSNSRIALSIFYGFSAGIATPFRLGEYAGRSVAFKDRDMIQVTAATALDKLFPLILTTFIGSISALVFIHFHYHVTLYITLSLFLLLLGIFYVIIFTLLKTDSWTSFLIDYLSRYSKLKSFLGHLRSFSNFERKAAWKVMLTSLLLYLCIIVQYALLVAAFSSEFNIPEYMWVGNLVLFAKSVIPPVSLGELGIREGASVFFISTIGLSTAVGFNASILLFFINVLTPALIGFLLLFKKD